jgi:iron(III) transport system substrate-binding protein
VKVNNAALNAMSGGGDFKAETIPLAAVGANSTKVQQMLDRVGFLSIAAQTCVFYHHN